MRSRNVYKKLDDFQKRAVDLALSVKTFALFFEQGTGKTWISGGVIESILDNKFEGLLVCLLANLETTWLRFLSEHLPQIGLYRDWETYKQAPTPKMLVTNYEGVPKFVQKARKRRFKIVIYDEAQRLRTRSTLSARTAKKLRNSAEYKLLLSGTPIDRQPQELWAQFAFLVPGLLYERWADFEDEFMEPIDLVDLNERDDKGRRKYRYGSFRYQKMMKVNLIKKRKRSFDFSKLDNLIRLIEPYSMRETKDVLGLPPLTQEVVPITIRGEQRSLYEDLETDLYALVNDTEVVAPLKMSKLGKLHQICGGYLIDNDGMTHTVGRAKLRAMKRILQSSETPVVIFCRYTEEVYSVAAEVSLMGYSVRWLTGKNKKDRPILQSLFQTGGFDVLVCQIDSGGTGLDLFRACTAILYSFSHSWIKFDQSISRIHRRGQTRPCQVYVLVCINTVDEDIYDAVRKKGKVVERVLTRLKRKNIHGKGKEGGRSSRQEERIQVRRV